MTIGAGNNNRATLHLLRRNPVLTAVMVCSLVLGMTALAAAYTVWRAGSSCSLPHKTVLHYVVRVVEVTAGPGVLMGHQAPRAA